METMAVVLLSLMFTTILGGGGFLFKKVFDLDKKISRISWFLEENLEFRGNGTPKR